MGGLSGILSTGEGVAVNMGCSVGNSGKGVAVTNAVGTSVGGMKKAVGGAFDSSAADVAATLPGVMYWLLQKTEDSHINTRAAAHLILEKSLSI